MERSLSKLIRVDHRKWWNRPTESPVSARGVLAIRPGLGFFLGWVPITLSIFFLFCSATIPSFAQDPIEAIGLEGEVSSLRGRLKWTVGGQIFEDDEISVRKFRFLPKIFVGGNFVHGEQKSPPQMAAERKAVAGIAAADQCKHLLICFIESRKYPAYEDVLVGSVQFSISKGMRPPRRGESSGGYCFPHVGVGTGPPCMGGYGTFL